MSLRCQSVSAILRKYVYDHASDALFDGLSPPLNSSPKRCDEDSLVRNFYPLHQNEKAIF
jgi:hypothetical protein